MDTWSFTYLTWFGAQPVMFWLDDDHTFNAEQAGEEWEEPTPPVFAVGGWHGALAGSCRLSSCRLLTAGGGSCTQELSEEE